MKKAELQSLVDQLQRSAEVQADRIRRLHREINLERLNAPRFIQRKRPNREPAVFSPQAVNAIKRAEAEWALDVTEPELGGDYERIAVYIKDGAGWGWVLEDGKYTHNGQTAWCGFFAAYCYMNLRYQIRREILPSCSRLQERWANSDRLIEDHRQIEVGDICTVWTSDNHSKSAGVHIVIASSPLENDVIETIEGNAKGYGPDNVWREGVSKRTRELSQIARVYRPQPEDYA